MSPSWGMFVLAFFVRLHFPEIPEATGVPDSPQILDAQPCFPRFFVEAILTLHCRFNIFLVAENKKFQPGCLPKTAERQPPVVMRGGRNWRFGAKVPTSSLTFSAETAPFKPLFALFSWSFQHFRRRVRGEWQSLRGAKVITSDRQSGHFEGAMWPLSGQHVPRNGRRSPSFSPGGRTFVG